METNLIARPLVAAVAAALLLCACDKDPARSMKIETRPVTPPPESAATAAAPANSPAKESPAPAPDQERAETPGIPAATPAPAPAASAAPPASPAQDKRPSGSATAAPAAAGPSAVRKDHVAAPKKEVAAAAGSGEWHPEGCPIPAEGAAGPSTLEVKGPCAFSHKGTFACEALADDFYISATRKAARGSTLMVYINVENFKGPGDYKAAQMFVGVQDKHNIYRWSSDAVAITLGPDLAYAVLPAIRLDAEPLLVDCTGPMNNYQCAGRGEHQVFMATSEIAAGKLQCAPGGGKHEPEGR